jgi:hypothetical protein
MLRRLFVDHPASVGETYRQHLCAATWFAGQMILGAAACLIHALLPFLFVRTGSRIIARLHDRMLVNRARLADRAEIGAEQARRDEETGLCERI